MRDRAATLRRRAMQSWPVGIARVRFRSERRACTAVSSLPPISAVSASDAARIAACGRSRHDCAVAAGTSTAATTAKVARAAIATVAAVSARQRSGVADRCRVDAVGSAEATAATPIDVAVRAIWGTWRPAGTTTTKTASSTKSTNATTRSATTAAGSVSEGPRAVPSSHPAKTNSGRTAGEESVECAAAATAVGAH